MIARMCRWLSVGLIGVGITGVAQAEEATSVAPEVFVADVHAFEGQLISIQPCWLSPQPIGEQMACTVQKADGTNALDPGGLPVAIFFDEAAIGDAERAHIKADCTSYCEHLIEISGRASVTDGTDYVKFTEVHFRGI